MGTAGKLGIDRAGAYVLGIDLGGTKILAAVVDEDGRIVARAKNATRPDLGPDGVIERIVSTIQTAVKTADVTDSDVVAIGIGAPAPVNPNTGVLYAAPNLPGWDRVELGPRLHERMGIPVVVDNDVNVGTLGEYVLGAGQGAGDMVGIFVGTGVGGGIIIDGQLRRGFRYSAGELGHMIMVPHGPLCGCGKRGCLEALASRTAIEREVRAAMATGRKSVVGDLLATSKKNRLTSGTIRKALDHDDALMKEVLAQAQFYLGLLVANVVNLLDPEMFVFGGGVVEALGNDFLQPIREVAVANFKQALDGEKVRIVPAELGDDAGVLGAAILASRQAFKRPTAAS